jgi:hypothetical protein
MKQKTYDYIMSRDGNDNTLLLLRTLVNGEVVVIKRISFYLGNTTKYYSPNKLAIKYLLTNNIVKLSNDHINNRLFRLVLVI